MTLKAYFSTYRSIRGRLFTLEGNVSGLSQEENQFFIDYNHYPDYCEAYSEVVIHFHHFIELTIKELLRREHPLLATDASSKPSILHKMLMKEEISIVEQEGLKSPEFQVSLERLYELVKKKRISDYKRLEFIVKAKLWLEKLNRLRNRLVHRGTFILRYTALDELVGGYILPFVQKALKLPIYSGSRFEWRYKALNCRVDPITKIVKEIANTPPNTRKIALLKELGRAAYENPLLHGPLRKQKRVRILDGIEQDAEKLTKAKIGEPDAVDVKVCPVCGVKALIVYGTIRSDIVLIEKKEHIVREEFYTYAVKCLCCSFEIEDELGDDCFIGLPIKSYWRMEELIPA